MKYILFIISTLICFTLHAQQEFQLTNFDANSLFINPAYAGSNGQDKGSLFLNYRDQWIGLEGSPKTMMIGGEYNIFEDKVGIGASISRESIGIDNRIDLLTNYSYRLKINEDDSYLSVGLRVGFHFFSSEFSKINYSDAQDNIYDGQNDQFNVLTVGTGVYYTNKDTYLGISIPALTTISQQSSEFRKQHFYLQGGSKVFFNDYNEKALEPTLLLKYEFAAPIQYSLGAKFWFISQFAIGALYRSEDGIAITSHLRLNEDLNMGVSYDFNTSELKQDNVGSIEIYVGYNITNDRVGW